MMKTPCDASTSSIQRKSSAEHARSGGGRCPAANARRARSFRQIDGQPADAAVVDAPEAGLEPFAERHNRAVRMLAHESAHLVVEPERAERVRFARRSEMAFEGIVDRVADLDRLRILEQGPGPAREGGPIVKRPEERLRDALKSQTFSAMRVARTHRSR